MNEETLMKRAEELAKEATLAPIIAFERKYGREPEEQFLQYALGAESDTVDAVKATLITHLRIHLESLKVLEGLDHKEGECGANEYYKDTNGDYHKNENPVPCSCGRDNQISALRQVLGIK